MKLSSAPNKMRTVLVVKEMPAHWTVPVMLDTPTRIAICAHVCTALGLSANTYGIAGLVTDYVYRLVGRRRQRVAISTDPADYPRLTERGWAGGSSWGSFPELGYCTWTVKNDGILLSRKLSFDQASMCVPSAHPEQHTGIICVPKPGTFVIESGLSYGGASVHDTTLPSERRMPFGMCPWPFPKPAIYSDGVGRVYTASPPTIYNASQFRPGVWRVLYWDTNRLASLHPDYEISLRANIVANFSRGSIAENHRVSQLVVDRLSHRIWVATECEKECKVECRGECPGGDLYCFDVLDANSPRVLFHQKLDVIIDRLAPRAIVTVPLPLPKTTTTWLSRVSSWVHGYCKTAPPPLPPPPKQCTREAFAVSLLHGVFAFMRSNGLVTIGCASTFRFIQDLSTGIPEQLTTVINFRFVDLPDAGGPVLAFLVETRPSDDRLATRSYEVRTFLC